jgi:hypothetical protein
MRRLVVGRLGKVLVENDGRVLLLLATSSHVELIVPPTGRVQVLVVEETFTTALFRFLTKELASDLGVLLEISVLPLTSRRCCGS